MDQPMVSFCLLTYNHEQFIGDCLKSVLAQTYENIEIIILNNHSVDKTNDVIQQYLPILNKKFSKVHYYNHNKNMGLVKGCNFLIKKANGDYIKLLSGDDVLMCDFFSITVDFLEKNKNYIMCYTNVFYIEENDRYENCKPTHDNIARKRFKHPKQKEQFFRLLLQNYIFTPSVLIRKDAYKKYGLYDEKIGYEDYEYFIRLSQSESFAYLDISLVGYRRSVNSMSNYTSKNGSTKLLFMFKETKKIIHKYESRLTYKQQMKCMESFYNRFFMFAVSQLYYKIIIYLYAEMKKNKIKLSKENKNYLYQRISKAFTDNEKFLK